jgi:uncharacterized membrane protein YgcG
MKVNAGFFALTVALIAVGCAAPRAELPMTASDLATTSGAAGLIAYLGQPDTDPEVCASTGVRLHDAGDLPAGLTAALVGGKVQPEAWGACVALLLPTLDPPQATELADAIVRAATAVLADARTAPTLRSRRIEALARVYLERAPGRSASDDAARALDDARRSATGPEELRAAGTLAVGLELERGRWQGRPVDAAAVDTMASDVGVVLLLRAARRLPDPALRTQAERLVVRQRIVASPFPEVRAAADSVEAVVLQRGTNPTSLADHPPVHASLAASALPARTVVVRQRPIQGTATLLGRTIDRPAPSVLPALSLRGAVQAQVAEVSHAITLCAPGRALDPTPCIAPSDVNVGSTLARIRDSGNLRIAERVSQATTVELARQGSQLRLPLSVGNAVAGTLEWPILFERPPDVVLSGRGPGEVGPSLTLSMERLDAAHVIYAVDGGDRQVSAVLQVSDATSFRVVSRGAPGADGAPGMDGVDGTPGLDGTSASCPGFGGSDGSRGGDGTSGGNGSDGSSGGRGGDIRVIVIATDQLDATLDLARASIASEGGPGGQGGHGGRGGRGGRGGQGGSGTTCTDTDEHTSSLSGGMSGMSGSDGSDGMSGRTGAKGQPGVVRFETSVPPKS